MKIKLVTFAPHANFGTCLQSYALNHVLRRMGHDVEFIYNRRETKPRTWKSYVKSAIKKTLKFILPSKIVWQLKAQRGRESVQSVMSSEPYIIELPNHRLLGVLRKLPGYKALLKWWIYDNPQKRKVYKFTFLDGNFKMCRLFTYSDYSKTVEDADLFITGSDQIWNPFCGGYNPMMLLEFVNDGTKCISYSSSISQPTIHPSIEKRMAAALMKFSHIAVREQSSVDLLNRLLGRNDVKLVVDPTYLLTVSEWEQFSKRADIEFELPQRYIFCYFVGSSRSDVYERMVQDVKKFTGINDVITLECGSRRLNYGGGRLYLDGGPYEWVYLLQHASYLCMDSFHATVFALKFKKDFVHVMKDADIMIGSQNTRMYDILSRYGILYKNFNDDGTSDWQQSVDYDKVTPLIEAEIKDSIEFLNYEIDA